MALTAGQRGLLRLLEWDGARAISRTRAIQHGALKAFNAALREGLIQKADHETTVKGDDFLEASRRRTDQTGRKGDG